MLFMSPIKNTHPSKHEALKFQYYFVYRIKNFIYSSKFLSVLLPQENEEESLFPLLSLLYFNGNC